MCTYVSTFITGFAKIIHSILKDILVDVKIIRLLDGVIIYKTKEDVQKIKNIKFFNNTFILIQQLDRAGNKQFEYTFSEVCKLVKFNIAVKKFLAANDLRTFRVVTSCENQLVSVNKKLLNLMETKLSKDYGISVNRVLPQSEFWFIKRSEGIAFFVYRITKHTSYEKVLHKGELRPELASLLCWLSEPNKDDIVLDPFCGYGAIPFERARIQPYKKIFAMDKDAEKIVLLKKKVESANAGVKNSVVISEQDFFALNDDLNGNIDKIITDPPWGEFEQFDYTEMDFYRHMLNKTMLLLKREGILVLLTSKKNEMDSILRDLGSSIILKEKLDILVSGKKAAVYKIVKK